DALVRARMAHQDVGLEPVRGGALLAVVDDLRLEEQRIHGGPGVEDRAALPGGPVLEPEAAAEDLEAGHDADPEDGERHRDLEQREPGCRRPPHPLTSAT